MNETKLEKIIEKCNGYFRTSPQGIEIIKEFGNGKSGSKVYLIEVNDSFDSKKNGKYILKISYENANEFLPEIFNTVELSRVQKSSITLKFPNYEYADTVENALFYVCDVAGSEFADPINICGNMIKGESILEIISRELLLEWNVNFSCKKVSLADYIEESIGIERLKPEKRIFKRIQRLIGDSLYPCFEYEGNIYPNPYFYLKKSQGPLSRQINAVIGQVHGDLNCNNVIVGRNIVNNSYNIYLIDYSHYKNNGYLFNDHAYLQLDMLLSGEASANVYEWNANVHHDLIKEYPNEGKYIYRFVKYIKNGIITFIKKYQSNNEDNCWIQYWCAQICAGLNWMNKNEMDEVKQALCFLYSSICLKELLCLLNYNIDNNANASLTLLGDDSERELWKILGKFNLEDNRYILISSCDSNRIDKEIFSSFVNIKWNGIFEITQNTDNEIRNYVLPKMKKRYGILYRTFPEINNHFTYELAPYWCSIQIPQNVNTKVWYKKTIQNEVANIVKSILQIRENYPIYIIVDGYELNKKILEEIITEIQFNAETSSIHIIFLDNYSIDIEEDNNLEIKNVSFSLENIAKCVSLSFCQEQDNNKIQLPQKDGKVYLEYDEANYVSMDFDIIHLSIGLNEYDNNNGYNFYHGAEPTWRDIAEHRDIDRLDYVSKWKEYIFDKIRGIGSDTVIACNLFHKAGAGGTTLSKRILWDFHSHYPCLFLKKISSGTVERLKLIYSKTKLPILIVVEITVGNITTVDLSNLRIELMNINIRALFICVSRMHNLDAKRYPNNFYLSSTPDMTMSPNECNEMHKIYTNMTDEQNCLENLYKLTNSPENEWRSLRQPFFYGLFTFGKDYTNIQSFVKKGIHNMNDKMSELIIMLAFMTKYSQIGLNKMEIEKIFNIEIKNYTENDLSEINPLIVRKSIGYQICHPIIAEQILLELFEKDNYINRLFEYSLKFIDMLTNIYTSDSLRLGDILEEIFTHREYYLDEEKMKFSNLIMEFNNDQTKKNIFEYLIKKLPNNPHYYNHLARVYIYPSERGNILDFDAATQIAKQAIEIAEKNENEGVGIHHHLLGKIYTKKCKSLISNSKFRENTLKIWNGIKPIFLNAQLEFSMCMMKKNMGFGLIGKMELISGVLRKISDKKSSSINSILSREPEFKKEVITLLKEMHESSIEYTMKYGEENIAYKRTMTDFYRAVGNMSSLEKQISLNNLTLKDRIYTRQAIVALKMWGEDGKGLYTMSQNKLDEVFYLIDKNIKESSASSRYDRLMWIKIFMRRKNYNVFEAYNFLMEWLGGDEDYYVCFYRYVLAFILYYNNEIDFFTVERHLKQSNMLAKNLYGISITNTRELVGTDTENIYLISDKNESELGGMNNEEREKFRQEHCHFFEGIISDFQNSMIYIKFSLDNEHSFIAKMPTVDNIGGVNVGDTVKFALGFSYSEMRAWNIQIIK